MGFFPNRPDSPLDVFFCTEKGQNANLNLKLGNPDFRVR